ncbi:unnamed protein product [Pleuronectes platessa]|uniref:Cadherin domain-containing protein n=1 Tax=Pleuronectes platessa TaxID=8262 RepID=A0A9N7Y7M9_PLEPL|nr:unnamed protein product [Pleuronectes platessa]
MEEEERTSIIQVTATDADDPTYGNSARLVYTLVQGQQYFSVDPQTGILRTAVPDMDRETQDQFLVVLQAKDMGGHLGGLSGTTTVTVHLTDKAEECSDLFDPQECTDVLEANINPFPLPVHLENCFRLNWEILKPQILEQGVPELRGLDCRNPVSFGLESGLSSSSQPAGGSEAPIPIIGKQ